MADFKFAKNMHVNLLHQDHKDPTRLQKSHMTRASAGGKGARERERER